MSVFDEYASNEQAEDEGVWTDLFPGFEVKITRLGNRDYQRALQRRQRPHRRAIQAGRLDPKTEDEITREAMVDTVFLDFRGPKAVDQDGEPMANTRANRLRLMEMRDFAMDLVDLAAARETFRQETLEEEAGN